MSDVWRWNEGDYVEHRATPGTVWQIRGLDRFSSFGPIASLRYIGGASITYQQREQIFDVWEAPSAESRVRNLREANPMLVLALESR